MATLAPSTPLRAVLASNSGRRGGRGDGAGGCDCRGGGRHGGDGAGDGDARADGVVVAGTGSRRLRPGAGTGGHGPFLSADITKAAGEDPRRVRWVRWLRWVILDL